MGAVGCCVGLVQERLKADKEGQSRLINLDVLGEQEESSYGRWAKGNFGHG